MVTMVASGKPQQPPAASILFNGEQKSVFNQKRESQESDQQSKTKRRLYRCTICGNAFTRWQALGGHKNIHRRYSAEVLKAIQPEMSLPPPQGQAPPELALPQKGWLSFRPASASKPGDEPPVKSPKRHLGPSGGVVVGWGSCVKTTTEEPKKTEDEVVVVVEEEEEEEEVDLELRLGPSAVDLQLRLGPIADQSGPIKLDPQESTKAE